VHELEGGLVRIDSRDGMERKGEHTSYNARDLSIIKVRASKYLLYISPPALFTVDKSIKSVTVTVIEKSNKLLTFGPALDIGQDLKIEIQPTNIVLGQRGFFIFFYFLHLI
jgi:hypothetical protein